MIDANQKIAPAPGADNDPIYTTIQCHRLAFEAMSAAGNNDALAEAEAAALRAVLECPATTLQGVRSALTYIANLIDAGWQLPNDDADVAVFHRACERAVERIAAARA
jgi:hypothetical protein